MRKDKAEARAKDLNAVELDKQILYYAMHCGRNRWIVNKRRIIGQHYGAPVYVEG